MSTILLTAGILLLTLSAIAYLAERLGSGHPKHPAALQLLPGDIKYESPSGNFRFYFPVTTSFVLSIVLTLLMRFFS